MIYSISYLCAKDLNMTIKGLLAEIKADLHKYDDSGAIDTSSVYRWAEIALKRFGGVIAVMSEAVDLGLKNLAVLSTGEVLPPLKPHRALHSRLVRLSRSLSRKKKGSSNRAKAKTKLAKLHKRIADIRVDALHKLTHRLATEFDTIAIEDLNVKGMVRNSHLARSVSDAGFGEFRRQLEYKAAMTGALVFIVDRFYPSSKTCSTCGALS